MISAESMYSPFFTRSRTLLKSTCSILAISCGSGFPFGLRVFVKNISTVPVMLPGHQLNLPIHLSLSVV